MAIRNKVTDLGKSTPTFPKLMKGRSSGLVFIVFNNMGSATCLSVDKPYTVSVEMNMMEDFVGSITLSQGVVEL